MIYIKRMSKKNRGFSLIEIVVVISIISILVVAAGFSFVGWIGKYRVESQIKEMYTDFTNARVRAMQRGRMHFIANTNTTYTIYEDTNPGPDGNESLETGSGGDTVLPKFPKTVTYSVNWDGIGGAGTTISINKNGIINPSGNIFLETTDDVDFDCGDAERLECPDPSSKY